MCARSQGLKEENARLKKLVAEEPLEFSRFGKARCTRAAVAQEGRDGLTG